LTSRNATSSASPTPADYTSDLSGTRVVVTGASSGLGLAMAAALTEAGALVMVTSRDQRRAEATAEELGPRVIACELDVRDEHSVAACVDRARKTWGGIDMLVNNAGIGMRTVNPRFVTEPQPFWEVTPAGFRDVIETKVVGCFLMARAVVPLMLRGGGGRVGLVGGAGRAGAPDGSFD